MSEPLIGRSILTQLAYDYTCTMPNYSSIIFSLLLYFCLLSLSPVGSKKDNWEQSGKWQIIDTCVCAYHIFPPSRNINFSQFQRLFCQNVCLGFGWDHPKKASARAAYSTSQCYVLFRSIVICL